MRKAGLSIIDQTIWVEPQVSINNWLKYSQVDIKKRHKIIEMHLSLDDEKKRYYDMTTDLTTGKIRCDFHCLILVGQK